jgi:hypothetical protein
MAENKALVKQPQEIVSTTMTALRLGEALTEEQNKRDLIKKYIQENLVSGTDFGKIKMGNKESKDCLFKPGAEKVCSLLHLKPVFKIDNDVRPIVGPDVIPYICELINRHSGEVEGEGRGSCSLKEKQGNANVAIKIAQKRAQIDAVLRVAALSDQFTQDLEDLGGAPERPTIPPPQPPQRRPQPVTTIKLESMDQLSAFTSDREPPVWEEQVYEEAQTSEVCQFGKNKGKRWDELSPNQLNWYRDFLAGQLNDPSKDQYKAGNESALQGVMNALETK